MEYECIAEVEADGGAKVVKYKSKRTGLTICLADIDGPIIEGFLCVPTEAHTDDGLAHTLEHLIFLGSVNYPYKGVLDRLANRCLAHGTNAWTATDHTCYTMSTAGSEGFLKLLPIYAEHLLYPLLTDEAYATEVHHINGEGEDAGVVYCEMQARENVGESLCHLAMLRAMYPGVCGYNVEHGGKVKNLRESTSNEKVKEFHRKFYCSENLCIIIVGKIKLEDIFIALQPIEEMILQDPKRDFVRPWQTPIDPLTESVTLQVEYPTDDDDCGIVVAAWRGPVITNYTEIVALELLLDYLTDTSISPLSRDLIEIEDPLANQISYSVNENSVSCIYLHVANVPVDKLDEAKEKLFSVITNIAKGAEEFDMPRLQVIMKKKKLYTLSSMEDDPHDHLADCLIADFLYGEDSVENLKNRLQEFTIIDKLTSEASQFWMNLLMKYFVDSYHVVVIGRPSIPLSESVAEEEKQRIQNQREKLGPEGLAKMGEILKQSVERNEIPPPKEMITSVSVPSVSTIKFHPIKTISNVSNGINDNISYSVDKMPCHFQLEDIKTNFVRLSVSLDTSELPSNLRIYLPLFIELLDESAISRNGKIISYQKIVKELNSDTISVTSNLGCNYSRFFCGSYAQAVSVQIMVEEEKYPRAVKWIQEILHKTVFQAPRIQTIVKKMMGDLPSLKREADSVTRTLLKNIVFQCESNQRMASMFRQASFLGEVLKQLETNPAQIISDLTKVRESITTPDKMSVHVSLNLSNMQQKVVPEDPWINDMLPPDIQPAIVKSTTKHCSSLLQPYSVEGPSGLIVGISAIETADFLQCCQCINSYSDPDFPALLVLVQYLTQSEGLIWTKIRGCGLAYGCGLSLNPMTGLIYLSLYESTHLVKAYEAVLEVMDLILKGDFVWDIEMIVSAKSSLMFEQIEKVKTVADMAYQSQKYSFYDMGIGFLHELLEHVSNVTTDDMQRATSKYLTPLFNVAESRCAICCHPDKVEEIVQGFQKFSRTLVNLQSLEDDILVKF